ncbi:DNA polymerase III subunit delta' [Actinomycetes bacterium]|nr:DNA polymerase III subunit delta' [Actinomycetes bacterium]
MSRVCRFEIDLDLALRMVSAARSAAEQLDACVSIAIVDAGGQLIAFARMDGAEIAGQVLARDKAYTAVAHRTDTGSLRELTASGGEFAGMYAADGGRYIAFAGGIPLWDDNRVSGGVGVSGSTGAQDATIAQAAAQIFDEANQ